MVGILSFASSSFNRGRSQVNPQFFGLGETYETKNAFLTGQGWGFIDPDNYNFDTNGYPTKIVGGALGNFHYHEDPRDRPGNRVMLWDGEGTMQSPGGSFVSGSLSSSAASVNNRYEYTPAAGTRSVTMGPSAVGSPTSYITNIRSCHVDDEAAVLSDPYAVGTKFKAKMAEAKFGVIRFLNWIGQSSANFSNVSAWDYRKPLTYAFWRGPEVRRSLYAGATTNSGDDFTLVTPWVDPYFGAGGPFDKQTILIKPNATSTTAAVRIDIGTGFKNVLQKSGDTPYVSGVGHSGRFGLGNVTSLVFDKDLDAWINNGTDETMTYLDNGVPIEFMMKLCREVGAHLYVPTPYLAWDKPQDGVVTSWNRGLATYCRDSAPSWMTPFFEGPNELFNSSVFPVWNFGGKKQTIKNGGNKPYEATRAPFAASSATYTPVTGPLVLTGTGTPMPVNSRVVLSSAFAPGLFGVNDSVGYVTATGAGSMTIAIVPTGGSFAGFSGASTIALANPATITVPTSVSVGQAVKLTTTGTLPASIPASGIVYAKSAGTTINIAATLGGANINTASDSQSGTHTATIVGLVNPATSDEKNWYGGAASLAFQEIAAVYGVAKAGVKAAVNTKYRTVIGVKTSDGASSSTTAQSDPLMSAATYVLQTGGDPASDWANCICCAQYIAPFDRGTAQETTYATAYSGWLGTGAISGTSFTATTLFGALAIGDTILGVGPDGSAIASGTTITGGSSPNWTVNNSQTVAAGCLMRAGNDLTAVSSYVAGLTTSGGSNATVPNVAVYYSNWGIWANGFGIKKMCGYEGGYSPDYAGPTDGSTSLDMLRAAGKYEGAVGTALTTTYNDFVGTGTVSYPSGFTADFPSCFQLSGDIRKAGYSQNVWSVLENIYQTPDPPQWTAIKAFNA